MLKHRFWDTAIWFLVGFIMLSSGLIISLVMGALIGQYISLSKTDFWWLTLVGSFASLPWALKIYKIYKEFSW